MVFIVWPSFKWKDKIMKRRKLAYQKCISCLHQLCLSFLLSIYFVFLFCPSTLSHPSTFSLSLLLSIYFVFSSSVHQISFFFCPSSLSLPTRVDFINWFVPYHALCPTFTPQNSLSKDGRRRRVQMD